MKAAAFAVVETGYGIAAESKWRAGCASSMSGAGWPMLSARSAARRY